MAAAPVDVVDRGRPAVVEVSADFCDACPSAAKVQAYVYARFTGGRSVSYCGHHGRKYMAKLSRQAVVVIDMTHLIPR